MAPLISLLILLVAGAQTQELQKEADPPLNCRREERARRGDRILLDYTGLLADGSTFDRASADFVIGDETVIRGLEEGMLGQCSGEKISMIVPPSLGKLDSWRQCGPLSLVEAHRGSALISRELHYVAPPVSLMP